MTKPNWAEKGLMTLCASLMMSVGLAGQAIADEADKILSCNQLVDAYAVNVDRRDGEAVGELFVEDGELYLGEESAVGRAAVVARFSVPNPRFKVIVHHMTSRVVENVTETGATGRVHAVFTGVPTKPMDGSDRDRVIQVLGYYDDVYTFEDGHCRFVKRTYTPKVVGAMDLVMAN